MTRKPFEPDPGHAGEGTGPFHAKLGNNWKADRRSPSLGARLARCALALQSSTMSGSTNMNIHDRTIETPKVTTGPLPASRKTYFAPAAAPELRVPVREIDLTEASGEPPLPVYDTTGPYTDAAAKIDVEQGLPRTRTAWVREREGVEEYAGRAVKAEDNGLVSGKHPARDFPVTHRPLRAANGKPVTQLEWARAGVVTKEMIYIAERENLGRKDMLERAQAALSDGESFGASLPPFVTPEFVRSEVARGRAIIP